MQMEGKKKKGKERERRRAQGVCQARRTCVVCVCPVLLGWSSLLAVAVWAFVVWCSGAIKI